MQIPANDVSYYRWTIHTSRAFQFREKCPSSAKSSRVMAVNKKVMPKQGGGMSADGKAQPSPLQDSSLSIFHSRRGTVPGMKSTIWAHAGQGVNLLLKFTDKCCGRSREWMSHTWSKPRLSESPIVLHLSSDYFISTGKHLVLHLVLSLASYYCTLLLKENSEEECKWRITTVECLGNIELIVLHC